MSSALAPSTHRAHFAIGSEAAARRVVDRLNESFFEGQAAIAAFERSDGRWDITMHFADWIFLCGTKRSWRCALSHHRHAAMLHHPITG